MSGVNGQPAAGSAQAWDVAVATDLTHGQDAHAVHLGDHGIWVVLADGATGRPDGAAAARVVVDTAIGYLVSTGYRVEDAYVAARTAEQALRAVIRAGKVHPDAATTLTILGVTEAGTCLVTRGDSPVWWRHAEGLDAWGERDAPFVTAAEPGQPEGSVGAALLGGELLIVATDGVAAAIPASLTSLPPVNDPAWTPAGLIDAARRGGSADDITVVTVGRAGPTSAHASTAADPDTEVSRR